MRSFMLAAFVAASTATVGAHAQQAPAAAQAATPALPLFAIEIRTGAQWDPAKPPQEQAFFREHSLNLKRLRDAGQLVAGARYSDIGLVIVQAESPDAVRGWMDADPSIKAQVFRYEVHPFNVFYPGSLTARPRAPASN